MAKSARTVKAKPITLKLFGPPPLFDDEDSRNYDDLLARISGTVKPADIFEEIWVRDIVDQTWEIFRWRRVKSQLIKANLHRGIKTVLESLCHYTRACELSTGWANGDEEDIQQVDELLSNADLTMDEVTAETIAIKISDIERMDHLIMSAEARRNAVLRDIDRHRANKRQAPCLAIDNVEDAEYVEIKPAQIKSEWTA